MLECCISSINIAGDIRKDKRTIYYDFDDDYYYHHKTIATNRDRTSDLEIFSLTLSQLSYSGVLYHTPYI